MGPTFPVRAFLLHPLRTLFEGHLEVHDLVGEIGVVRDRQDGGPIRDLHAMVCPWIRGKSSVHPPRQSSVSMSGPPDCPRPRPEVSPRSVLQTLVGPPSASGTGACCPPACWEKVPSAASGGSLGSPGAPCPPASAPPGRVPLGKGWPLHHLLWVLAEVTGVELFSPGVRPVVATQVMPMVKGKGPLTMPWTSQPPGPGGTRQT